MTAKTTEYTTQYPVFLLLDEVSRRTGPSHSTIRRQSDCGKFPKPVKLTTSRLAFVESEVIAWQQEIIDRSHDG